MTDSEGTNPYRPPVPPYGQQPAQQPYGQPYAQPYGQPYAKPYPQPYPPYGPPSYAPPRGTNGMATASLVTGLVAALLSVVFGIAATTLIGGLVVGLGVVAIGLGLVAVVLGIAGIRGSASAGGRGMAIGGILAGVVAVVAVGALTTIVSLSSPDAASDGSRGQAVEQDDSPADAKDPRSEPDDPGSPLDGVAAPAGSTANGGIPVGPSGVAGTTDGAASDAVVVTLYSDYMCPFCGQFESVNGATLSELRAQGDIVLEYHPVSILDQASLGSGYSTRAAAAAALVADRAPRAFVGFDAALFAHQPEEGTTGWTDEEIAGIARDADVPEEVAVLIESSAYLTDADSFVPWVAAATEQGARDLGSMGTPTVLLDGAPLTVDWAVPGALAQAIEQARLR